MNERNTRGAKNNKPWLVIGLWVFFAACCCLALGVVVSYKLSPLSPFTPLPTAHANAPHEAQKETAINAASSREHGYFNQAGCSAELDDAYYTGSSLYSGISSWTEKAPPSGPQASMRDAIASMFCNEPALCSFSEMYPRLGGGTRLINNIVFSLDGAKWPGTFEIKPLPDKVEVIDPVWQPLIVNLINDGFPKDRVEALFSSIGPGSYSPSYMAAKVSELHGARGIGPQKSGEENPPIPDGFVNPLDDVTVGACRKFAADNAELFKQISRKHGVPREVVMAVLLVETGFGKNLGHTPAFTVLASMAATDRAEMLAFSGNSAQTRRLSSTTLAATLKYKSSWAYNELKALIFYAESQNIHAASIPGSMYGAIGLCQFMPSNIIPYGADGDNDGIVDLFNVDDALFSVARYLEAHGWRMAKSRDAKHMVVFSYNHDYYYATSVLGISEYLATALAQQSKISAGASPMGGFFSAPAPYIDPSLRRGKRPVPKSARLESLDSYDSILKK